MIEIWSNFDCKYSNKSYFLGVKNQIVITCAKTIRIIRLDLVRTFNTLYNAGSILGTD